LWWWWLVVVTVVVTVVEGWSVVHGGCGGENPGIGFWVLVVT
jgi:hypothetical protein